MNSFVWDAADTVYLEQLSATCALLAQRFKEIYDSTKNFQSRIKLPMLALSSVAGIASFGSGTFPPGAAQAVSIAVGVANVVIAIAAAIDSYYNWTGVIQRAIKASNDFAKLRERIDLELALPVAERELAGSTMCRNSHQEFESIQADAPPVLKNLRWIKGPISRVDIESASSLN
jgi:hypothetical protein